MLEIYENMGVTQKRMFADICNRLLATTFLARDKKDNKEDYYFFINYKEVFDQFFEILGYTLKLDTATGAIMLQGGNQTNTLKLKRDESILLLIIRLLYHEKLKETSLNENVVCSISDLHEKYDYLEIKRKINKTDLVNSLRLFRKYNLIEIIGDIQSSSSKIVILPTILMAIESADITEIAKTLDRITQEGVE